jgi:pimeloyl-ACP methyl ester carboxylesterase
MWAMERALKRQGYAVLNFAHPTRRQSLDALVAHLAARIGGIRPAPGRSNRLHGVGHSLGGIVLLALFARMPEPWQAGRLVAIGSPFQGAKVADVVAGWRLGRGLFGPVLRDLGWESAALRGLAADGVEVGAIAGGGRFAILNPGSVINARLGVLKQSDGTVETAAALGAPWLPPFADRLQVEAGHALMPARPGVIQGTLHFLEHGRFAGGATEARTADAFAPDQSHRGLDPR